MTTGAAIAMRVGARPSVQSGIGAAARAPEEAMRAIDLSSWPALLSTLLGLAVVTLVVVGLRLLVMQRVQQRHQRENRQINERLRTLIAAYKTLGGSFTGDLAVDPTHLRALRQAPPVAGAADHDEDQDGDEAAAPASAGADRPGGERRRRVRDAVEAALADVILLGTEEQVRLAARAAAELAAGRPVETAELVVSLRNFIRQVLDLDPVPRAVDIPRQGPVRPAPGRGGARGDGRGGRESGREPGRESGRGGRAGGAGGAMLGAGLGGRDQDGESSR
jgi:hypothetical protein